MSSPVEFQEKKSISLGLFVWFLAGAITATFSLTMIYNRFLFVEEQMTDIKISIEYMESQHDAEIEYFNGRLDRKVADLEELIKLHIEEKH